MKFRRNFFSFFVEGARNSPFWSFQVVFSVRQIVVCFSSTYRRLLTALLSPNVVFGHLTYSVAEKLLDSYVRRFFSNSSLLLNSDKNAAFLTLFLFFKKCLPLTLHLRQPVYSIKKQHVLWEKGDFLKCLLEKT